MHKHTRTQILLLMAVKFFFLLFFFFNLLPPFTLQKERARPAERKKELADAKKYYSLQKSAQPSQALMIGQGLGHRLSGQGWGARDQPVLWSS